MKISRRDLDSSILEKLDLLDGVAATYDENNPDGYVSYGRSGFYFKKTNDTFLKKVFSEDEIISLENGLAHPERNMAVSSQKDMRANKKKYNAATVDFLHDIELTNKIATADAVKVFETGTKLAVVFKSGKIAIVSQNDKLEIDFINQVTSQFAISDGLAAYDIIDVKDYDGYIVVATRYNGIYRLKISDPSRYDLIVSVADVRCIEMAPTGMLFVCTDSMCAFYDIESGLRSERYLNIAKDSQIPVDSTINEEGNLYVIAAPAGSNNLDNLMHFWKIDAAHVGYNCKDSSMPRNPIDRRFQPMFMRAEGHFLYVSGLFKEEKLFVWKYNIQNMSLETEVFDLELDDYRDFVPLNGKYLILSGRMIYLVEGTSMKMTFRMNVAGEKFILFNGQILVLTRNGLYELELPNFDARAEQLVFNILDMPEPCNNIDICIIGATRAERISLFDAETNTELTPSYYMVYDGRAILKLINSRVKKLGLRISVNEKTKLKGIVAKQNRIFLR